MRSSCRSVSLLLILATPTVLASQSPFQAPCNSGPSASSAKEFELEWPVKRVAIIGAGLAGLTSYRELTEDGFDAHIFERDSIPSGEWHYTDERPFNAPIPNANVAVGDFEPTLPPAGVQFPYVEEYHNMNGTWCALQRKAFFAPRSIWKAMKTNGVHPAQEIRGFPWPKNTEWFTPSPKVGRYLRAFASWNQVNSNDDTTAVSYNTRVELVEKRLDSSGKQIGWTLTTKKLEEISGGINRATWNKEHFDAIVVASGRFNTPNMPAIDGLEQWGKRFPNQIAHSRQYRDAADYAGKNVLVVGAVASGHLISREIAQHAAKTYTSVRPQRYHAERPTVSDYVRLIPQNVSIVAEIKRFHTPGASIQDSRIELVDGTILTSIHHIVFATGYRYGFPFLPEYHDPSLGKNGEPAPDAIQPIVTDGSHLRSLHLDTFYIDNPTIGFVYFNTALLTFSYAEYQAFALSMVWSGKAKLPSREEMWKLYHQRIKDVGYGKQLSLLGWRIKEMIQFFTEWLNPAAAKHGSRQIDGLSFDVSQILDLWLRASFGDTWLVRNVTIPAAGFAPATNDDSYEFPDIDF
ncbi:hypothetical protein NP233_g8641 [Leucocoprinus birnbaumii]|uniref:FAD/NAD(P)-binding domain-containing protein n=1 Tax=Leucocoprinus birnbaumii TaxID=56174 RepID=A0AAD5YMY7_9AGAR|nr:hypothetical protein NP233_g8641 [Leucocoprinus birnbaumii]